MLFPIEISDCDLLIQKEKSTIKYYLAFGTGIFLLGVILFFIGNLYSSSDVMKSLMSVGGVFVSSLTSLQMKEIISARRKISSCNILKSKIIFVRQENLDLDKDKLDALNAFICELYKKLLDN